MVNKYLLAIILLIASSFFWSGNFFAGKIAYNTDLSPFKLSFFRWTLAFIILLPFTYNEIKKNLKYYKENLLLISLIAFLGVTIFNSFTYISLQTTLVINSALMNSVTPVLIIGFSWLIFKTKTSLLQFIGIFLSVIGAFCIILKGNLNNLYSFQFTSGDIWMFIAALSWCVYSVLLRKIDKNLSQLATLEVLIFFGLIFLLPLYLIESSNSTFIPDNSTDYLIIIYVAIFASIVSFFSWNMGVSIIGANRAGLFLHLIPVFSSIWAISFLGEQFVPLELTEQESSRFSNLMSELVLANNKVNETQQVNYNSVESLDAKIELPENAVTLIHDRVIFGEVLVKKGTTLLSQAVVHETNSAFNGTRAQLSFYAECGALSNQIKAYISSNQKLVENPLDQGQKAFYWKKWKF